MLQWGEEGGGGGGGGEERERVNGEHLARSHNGNLMGKNKLKIMMVRPSPSQHLFLYLSSLT